ncbi:hypothetical protein niasHT_025887 [Heterodera trifolii]|uniref:Uncharacterized protein n=1 Tax=Heterodera trifolii TaxID=157864 RepID=A0ABD2KJQ9_9BILA
MKPHFSTKHFVHHVEQLGKRLFTVTYDLKILSPNFAPGDLFGHLLAQNKLPLPFYKEVRVKFEFVRDETRKFDAKLVALRIENALKTGENLDDTLLGAGANSSADDFGTSNCDSSFKAVTGNADNEAESLFEEQFRHVMRNASMVELSKLITAESRMTKEMRSLVRARNFEVGRIKLTCEQTLAQSVAYATEFDKHSYEISMLNEKLRQVSINYSHQIEALTRISSVGPHNFASLVSSFSCADDTFVHLSFISQCFCTGTPTNHHSFHDHLKSHVTFMRFENYGPTPTTFSDIASIHRQPVATSKVSPLRASPFALFLGPNYACRNHAPKSRSQNHAAKITQPKSRMQPTNLQKKKKRRLVQLIN